MAAPYKRVKLAVPDRLNIQFYTAEGEAIGTELDIESSVSPSQMQALLNALRQSEDRYSFYLGTHQILETLQETCSSAEITGEGIVPITFFKADRFRVNEIFRNTETIKGHTEAIVALQFSGDGKRLATGSGDTTIRIWDLDTATPEFTLNGHKHWVIVIAWSPNGAKLASASVDGGIMVWDTTTSPPSSIKLAGHKKYVSSLTWKPVHRDSTCSFIASSSKDMTVKVWNTVTGHLVVTLGGHSKQVNKVLWGGEGYLYTASQDRTIRVWSETDWRCIRELKGHGHWVNHLSLSTDFALRCGGFDPSKSEDLHNPQDHYNKILGQGERLVSCSNDYTMFLWKPTETAQPIARMTGHQQLVYQALFSPDSQYIISCSNDKSIRIWNGFTGQFIRRLLGHISPVYVLSWCPDSRLFVSCSKDSTIKIWSVNEDKAKMNLPGHSDEVYAIDWSPDGSRIASGSKDCYMRIWCN